MSGVVSRSGWSRSSPAVQPLRHSPPRLVGNHSGVTSAALPAVGVTLIAHCSAQYGQCV